MTWIIDIVCNVGGPPRPGMLPTPPMGGPPMMPMMPPPHGMMPAGPGQNHVCVQSVSIVTIYVTFSVLWKQQ